MPAVLSPAVLSASAAALPSSSFPSPELLCVATSLFPARPRWDGSEPLRCVLELGPGVLGMRVVSRARLERTSEREATRHGGWLLGDDGVPYWPAGSSRRVTCWSARSRSRLVRRLSELDYAPLWAQGSGRLVMVTLTYPGDWQAMAASGKAAKQHLRTLVERWQRAWGYRPALVWKLEVQRRGAPHLHLALAEPDGLADGLAFRVWLSHAWSEIVAASDPRGRSWSQVPAGAGLRWVPGPRVHRGCQVEGVSCLACRAQLQQRRHLLAGTGVDRAEGERMRDPKRLAVYFCKHSAPGMRGSKEYQHQVPEFWLIGDGPGRFWGHQGLDVAVQRVDVDPVHAVTARRLLRRWSRAQGRSRPVEVERADVASGQVRRRGVRRRAFSFTRGRLQGGWVLANDGVVLAGALARWLDQVPLPAVPLLGCLPADAEFPADLGPRVGHLLSAGRGDRECQRDIDGVSEVTERREGAGVAAGAVP